MKHKSIIDFQAENIKISISFLSNKLKESNLLDEFLDKQIESSLKILDNLQDIPPTNICNCRQCGEELKKQLAEQKLSSKIIQFINKLFKH